MNLRFSSVVEVFKTRKCSGRQNFAVFFRLRLLLPRLKFSPEPIVFDQVCLHSFPVNFILSFLQC